MNKTPFIKHLSTDKMKNALSLLWNCVEGQKTNDNTYQRYVKVILDSSYVSTGGLKSKMLFERKQYMYIVVI